MFRGSFIAIIVAGAGLYTYFGPGAYDPSKDNQHRQPAQQQASQITSQAWVRREPAAASPVAYHDPSATVLPGSQNTKDDSYRFSGFFRFFGIRQDNIAAGVDVSATEAIVAARARQTERTARLARADSGIRNDGQLIRSSAEITSAPPRDHAPGEPLTTSSTKPRPPVKPRLAPRSRTTGLDPRALVYLMHKELRRVGCYSGPLSSRWNRLSMRAIERFNAHARTSLSTDQPDSMTVIRVKTTRGRVCPEPCAVGLVRNKKGVCAAPEIDRMRTVSVDPALEQVRETATDVNPITSPSHLTRDQVKRTRRSTGYKPPSYRRKARTTRKVRTIRSHKVKRHKAKRTRKAKRRVVRKRRWRRRRSSKFWSDAFGQF